MNSLSSLLKVCQQLPDETNSLATYEAERYKLQTPNGKSIADVGCEPILHMRQFQVIHLKTLNILELNLKFNFVSVCFVFVDSAFGSLMQASKKLPEKLVYQILHLHGDGRSLSSS